MAKTEAELQAEKEAEALAQAAEDAKTPEQKAADKVAKLEAMVAELSGKLTKRDADYAALQASKSRSRNPAHFQYASVAEWLKTATNKDLVALFEGAEFKVSVQFRPDSDSEFIEVDSAEMQMRDKSTNPDTGKPRIASRLWCEIPTEELGPVVLIGDIEYQVRGYHGA